MAIDFTVAAGDHLVLDEHPPAHLAGTMSRLEIRTFSDLVGSGAVSSNEALSHMITAAKRVTEASLAPTGRGVLIPGTRRPDLQRFGGFAAATTALRSADSNTFWQIFREIEPSQVAALTATTNLTPILPVSFKNVMEKFKVYLFKNVVVEVGATLELASSVKKFTCHDLLIKRSGKILVRGSGTLIKTFSIKGEK